MQKSLSKRQFFILSYFAYACTYIARLNLTIASPVMQEQRILTSSQVGAMGGAFFLCYSVGQLLNGFLGDLFPPRRMVTTGLLLTALGNILIGFLPPAGVVLVLWGINGFAQSMLWGPLLRALAARFPGNKQAEIASCLVSSVGVGSVLGILIATAAISFQDVRFAFLLPGLIAALAGGAVFFFFRVPCPWGRTDRPSGSHSASRSGAHRSIRARLSDAGFSRRRFSALCSPRLMILLTPAMFHGVLECGNPFVKELMETSSYTLNGHSVLPTVTLPCHTSMFYGVPPKRHGILTNTYTPPVRPVPGIAEQLSAAGKVCAAFHNWEPIRHVWTSECMKYTSYIHAYEEDNSDLMLTEQAAALIRRKQPDFLFIHMVETDEKGGHDHGWMSPEYLQRVSNAFSCAAGNKCFLT